MNFNMFLLQFGLDPQDFIDIPPDPIVLENGFCYVLHQKLNDRTCMYCKENALTIHDHRWITLTFKNTYLETTKIKINRIRVKCSKCGKVYTVPIYGHDPYSTIASKITTFLKEEYKYVQSFANIAKRYGLSTARVLQIFDELYPIVKRKSLPEALCIDEIKFEADTDSKYIAILSDYVTGATIDIIKSRQEAYLDDYFRRIPEGERKNTKVFISDMYKGFARAHNLYFPKSLHCIDLYHVVTQIKNVVSTLRKRTIYNYGYDHEDEAKFMKKHWELFEMNEFFIGNGRFLKWDGELVPNRYMITDCLKLNQNLWDAYRILQELLQYDKYDTFESANRFMDRIINKLLISPEELLVKVGQTYKYWKTEICNGLVRNKYKRRYTNGTAEGNNSHLKTILKVSYGYGNFERFRKRALLIRNNNIIKK